MLSLLYLTLALVWIGGLGIFAVTGESLYDAFWQVGVPRKHAFGIAPPSMTPPPAYVGIHLGPQHAQLQSWNDPVSSLPAFLPRQVMLKTGAGACRRYMAWA